MLGSDSGLHASWASALPTEHIPAGELMPPEVRHTGKLQNAEAVQVFFISTE